MVVCDHCERLAEYVGHDGRWCFPHFQDYTFDKPYGTFQEVDVR